ncbi:hypothetical protein [Paenibacillus daejeonensis]|uniref:hypothetical protein n=1 Tax=Paenibacillus daejeonensis TaxID=135193 RepID=UPI00035CE490|nr:hypothetical protein [Paenibacillus daejeonensis]
MKKVQLQTSADINDAFLRQLQVEVWDGNRLEDYGGQIERHIKDAARINGVYYVKSQYQFYILQEE